MKLQAIERVADVAGGLMIRLIALHRIRQRKGMEHRWDLLPLELTEISRSSGGTIEQISAYKTPTPLLCMALGQVVNQFRCALLRSP